MARGLFFLLVVSLVLYNQRTKCDRNGKLLNVFNIVRFPNDPCTAGDVYGSCFTSSECSSLGGRSVGSCASGFGVCCTIYGNCGGSSKINNSYFSSTTSDTSICSFEVCKSESDICQIRLDFGKFTLNNPTTITSQSSNPSGRTQCLTSMFWATSNSGQSPTICGTNTGYHMIVGAKDDCNQLNFLWTSSTTRAWDIRISQISCTAAWRPPEDCMQWFTGTSNVIYSYNYAGGYHLANQDYNNCIRTEQGYCSIAYTAVSTTSFQVSGQNPPATATGVVGPTCTLDFITIPQGDSCSSPDPTSTFERFCGSLLTNAIGTTTGSVCQSKSPFRVGVTFDGTEVDVVPPSPPAVTVEYSKGFYIYYTQTAC